MIKIPYIKIKQRNETFFVTKFRSDILLNYIDFHFRNPYIKYQNEENQFKEENYINKIKNLGIELQSTDEGIQRRLQYDRIKNISDFLKSDELNFLPNSILVSANLDEDDPFFENYLKYENEEIGFFDFPEYIKFSIIDGQHRLGGLSLTEESLKQSFELVVIILFNVSIPTAAKLFSDINGKQKAVNKSLIYDLEKLIGKEYQNKLTNYQVLCESFYTSPTSPLYRQIKMLGVGNGAISQAFFIESVSEAIEKISNLTTTDLQNIYNHLFYYFKAFQIIFPTDWPVPLTFNNNNDLENYAQKVLKTQKSQLLKTNGFGAIMKLFPQIYSMAGGKSDKYLDLVSKLKGKVSWVNEGSIGTGKSYQNKLLKDMQDALI